MTKPLSQLTSFMLFLSILFACNPVKKDWEKTKEQNTPEAYKAYIAEYPESEFAQEANLLYDSLEWAEAFADIDSLKIIKYVVNHPTGKYIDQAKIILDSLEWAHAFELRDSAILRFLLNRNPESRFKEKADEILWEINWPPKKIEKKPANFIESQKLSFKEWVNVKFRGSERMAFVIRQANLKIQENIFNPEKIEKGLVYSQLEVLFYDDNQTFIKVDSLKNDKILFIYLGPGQFHTTFNVPGTTIKYQNKTYKLKEDGWYLDDKRIHKF